MATLRGRLVIAAEGETAGGVALGVWGVSKLMFSASQTFFQNLPHKRVRQGRRGVLTASCPGSPHVVGASPREIFLGLSTIFTARAAAARIPKVKGSRTSGEDTLKRNDPVQHQRGLTVLMRRTASGAPDHSRIHLRVGGTRVDFA